MAAAIRSRFNGLARKIVNINFFRNSTNESGIHRFCFHTSAYLNVVGQEIRMPSLSPTMTSGTIIKWLKKEGDSVAPGDVLCEIQTDKAVMSFETEEEGILAKILLDENEKEIEVGSLIAMMVAEGEDWHSVELPSNSSPSKNNIPAFDSSGGNVSGTNIVMPSLSPTMTVGTIVQWHKNPGDTISPGDVLCDIQTDKAVMSFETEEEGILAKILVPEGTADITVGTLIALMVAEGEDWKDVMVPSTFAPSEVQPSGTEQATESVDVKLKSEKPQNYGPAVRFLLELYRLDSTAVIATGRNKKLLKSDVLSYISEKKLQPKPPVVVPLPGEKKTQESAFDAIPLKRSVVEKYIDIELSSMRKTIAKRLTESKISIPHAYATMECAIDLLLSFRKQLKEGGVIVSLNDFVIRAVAMALDERPHMNCLFMNDQITAAPGIDVSVAVATDSGLITPIVKNANVKSIDEISSEVKELAARARVGKLQLHEFQGGSFTISNLGMFGISEFSAIINPPQCGILAVGGGRSIIDIDGKPVTKMTSTLSYDARAVSESAATDFLETLQSLLQNPANILLGSRTKKVKVRA